MKKFSVSLKDANEDYILTNNTWLTISDQKEDYRFFKKDNRVEFIFGMGKEDFPGIKIDKALPSNFQDYYQKLLTQSQLLLIYINTYENFARINNQIDSTLLIYKSDKHQFISIKNNDSKISILPGDIILGFGAAVSKNLQESILNFIQKTNHISHLLLEEVRTLCLNQNGQANPLFIINITPHIAYDFPIASSLKTVTSTIELIKNKVLKYHTEKIWQIETVLHEALVNAITYGNEIDTNKDINISYEIGDNGLRVIIRDKGEGFDVHNISVPVGEEALDRISGRGIYIMKKFTDALFYNPTGNEVILFFNF